ncbi:MAG: radical SAM protein [Planctomycetes bacterium]|nr:radical SAM protein [Planctomycetota bacterium]
MGVVISKPDTHQKLRILSKDGQYDLACACGTGKNDRRSRGGRGNWIYPVTLPNGGKSVLFKTLISNLCSNDCKYCPLRAQADVRRCSLDPGEIVNAFLDYYRRREVFGLFLSSGVMASADNTMENLTACAEILRKKHKFRGYIHLKILPGSGDAAIEKAVSLASAVSLNIETPGEANLAKLSHKKNYLKDIIEPMKLISSLTAKGGRYSAVKQTTQFIVGAAGESDAEIVKYTNRLYDRLRLDRVYFSAYQKDPAQEELSLGKDATENTQASFIREHRLYQVDFLLRKYGFAESDILYDENGRLSLRADPKEVWAVNNPGFFPVKVNSASKNELLRVPGLGPITVRKILQMRKFGQIRSIDDIGRETALLRKAQKYLYFGQHISLNKYLFI